jgi:hypothetical protein
MSRSRGFRPSRVRVTGTGGEGVAGAGGDGTFGGRPGTVADWSIEGSHERRVRAVMRMCLVRYCPSPATVLSLE